MNDGALGRNLRISVFGLVSENEAENGNSVETESYAPCVYEAKMLECVQDARY